MEEVIEKINVYDDTINPFNKRTARDFVYEHRNIMDEKTIRRIVYADNDLIVVKEINYYKDTKYIWFWGFSKTKRAIIRIRKGKAIKNKEAINKLKVLL